MTPQELHRVMKSRCAGVMGDDLREEIARTFRDRTDLLPEPGKTKLIRLANEDPETFWTLVDIAALSAQCRLRRAHGLPEPLG